MATKTDTPQTTAAKARPTNEDLAQQVELLKSDISRLTETLGDYGRARGREAVGEARRRADMLRHDAEDRIDDVEDYVRQNPATALGIAAGIGLLIGLLSR